MLCEQTIVSGQPPKLPTVRSEEQEIILDLGLKALRRINSGKSWLDWMSVADAVGVITEFAVADANSGPWHRDNKRAVRAFNILWEDYEKSEGSNYKPLSSSERTQLRFIKDHPEVEVWRATLDTTKQRALNHPNAVVSAWRKATQTPDANRTAVKKEKQDIVVALELELADTKTKLRHAQSAAEWTAPDTLIKAEDVHVEKLANEPIAARLEHAKRFLTRLGIADLNKALASPKKKRVRAYSQE
jgi:hypothetical protein